MYVRTCIQVIIRYTDIQYSLQYSKTNFQLNSIAHSKITFKKQTHAVATNILHGTMTSYLVKEWKCGFGSRFGKARVQSLNARSISERPVLNSS